MEKENTRNEKPASKRTKARETLFKYVFSTVFSGENASLRKSLYRQDSLTEDDVEYCEEIVRIIDEHRGEMDEMIDRNSVSFPEKNIFPADKSVLYIAIAEILYTDIPHEVSIYEASNLASKYSSDKSAFFIGGVLSGVVNDNGKDN